MEETSVDPDAFKELFLVRYNNCALLCQLPLPLLPYWLLKVVANLNYFYFGGLWEASDLGKR